MLQLGSPKTWAASIIPVTTGIAAVLAFSDFGKLIIPDNGGWAMFVLRALLMFLTAVSLQAAVNTFNDYADFRKGTDTADNSVDLVDVPLISRNLNPKAALYVGLGYTTFAGITGFSLAAISSWNLVIWGVIGALVMALYSFGPKPISYLPIAEIVSGITMGGIITVATWYALTQVHFGLMYIIAIPATLSIANQMQANNTCDIERDIEAGRRTLPSLIGRKASAYMITVLYAVSYAAAAAVLALHFPKGLIVLGLAFLFNLKKLSRTITLEYSYKTRPKLLEHIVSEMFYINFAFILSLLIGALLK